VARARHQHSRARTGSAAALAAGAQPLGRRAARRRARLARARHHLSRRARQRRRAGDLVSAGQRNPTRTERGEVWVYDSADEVARNAAEAFVAIVAGALADGAVARVALAGGSTPKAMYRLLASPALRDRVEWRR